MFTCTKDPSHSKVLAAAIPRLATGPLAQGDGDCVRHPRAGRGQQGFNLIELLMSMGLATILFMAITYLYVQQGQLLSKQNDVADMDREGRFVIDHLRRDLMALGSNSTPNSVVDALVCPQPDVPIKAIQLSFTGSYLPAADLNPGIKPVAVTLFGSLDVKRRFRTVQITGSKVMLYDDGTNPLPASQAEYDQFFTSDRYLRISGADGKMMFYRIVGASAGDASVTVSSPIAHQGEGQACGYQGFGSNYWVDVQGFVRYKITGDFRPSAPILPGGAPARTLLVRERLRADGVTTLSQTILAENVVDLSVFDLGFDLDPAPDKVKTKVYPYVEQVLSDGGDGLLGQTDSAIPEELRFLTVKVSLRGEWPDPSLTHQPRQTAWGPLQTYALAKDGSGSEPVVTLASRVYLPTMVSRNL